MTFWLIYYYSKENPAPKVDQPLLLQSRANTVVEPAVEKDHTLTGKLEYWSRIDWQLFFEDNTGSVTNHRQCPPKSCIPKNLEHFGGGLRELPPLENQRELSLILVNLKFVGDGGGPPQFPVDRPLNLKINTDHKFRSGVMMSR